MLTESFAAAVAEAEQIISAAPHISSDADLAEGYDYLAGNIRGSLQLAWAYQLDFPYFIASTGPYTKMGLDNPDALYFHSYLRDDAEYVVTGRRGSTRDLSFQVLKGDYTPAEVPDSLTAFDDRALDIAADGTFGLRFGPPVPDPGPQYYTLAPGSSMLVVREVYSDWAAERRGTISIRRADRAGCAPPPEGVSRQAKRYGAAGKILLSRLRTFLAFPEWFYLNLPVNTMTPPRRTPGGLATQFSSAGHYRLAGDEAMIVTVPAAPREVAPYQGIQLGSMWYVSLDYINHQTSLTADQARGQPGRPAAVRDLRAGSRGRELAGDHRPSARLRADPLAAADQGPGPGRRAAGGGCPVRGPARPAALRRPGAGDPRGVGPADRGPAGRGRRPDAGLMALLEGTVVVVSGVGPDLGRSIALRCARAGADLVLAARTAARLDEVAKEVTALGRRAAAIPADITDETSAAGLAEAAVAAFGRVDTLIHNAFVIPPHDEPGQGGSGHVPESVRNKRHGGPEPDPPADPGAGGARRLGRDDQLGGAAALAGHVRRLQDVQVRAARPGRRAWPPSSGRRASGSTRSPPAGSGAARCSGTSGTWPISAACARQVVYDETAASTDLRRLPEPDEVADAVVFLASPMARAITGQCLDVNCGEFHH